MNRFKSKIMINELVSKSKLNFRIIFLLVISTILCTLLIESIKLAKLIIQIDQIIYVSKNTLDVFNFKNYYKLEQIKDVIKLKNKLFLNELPIIYIITPTHARPQQMAELTRLQNTLRSVPKCFWIVIEDSSNKSGYIEKFLNESNLNFVHLNFRSPNITLTAKQKLIRMKIHRGSAQRNHALDWIRKNTAIGDGGVVYFADDDNSYKLDLFQEVI
jgi:hypothetical protein